MCPNQCKSDTGSDVEVLRKDLEKHKNKECPRRQFLCLHCLKAGEYQEITTTHLKECPEFKLICPNRGCLEEMPRRKISQHRRDCPFEEVSCKYARIGCQKKVLLKDRADHESDDKEHLQVAIDTVHKHQGAIHSLKEEVAYLQSQLQDQFTFKLEKYSENKCRNSRVYSPPFYSSPGGYKMCLSVFANGNGRSRDKDVSVFIHLMCGKNDDHLAWPFTGIIDVALLNQIEDDNHRYRSVKFARNESGQRVDQSSSTGIGFGWIAFLPHSQLNYNESENRQYLQDDTLYFRVTVTNTPATKPWLSTAETFECN